jgi:hypothetical protein
VQSRQKPFARSLASIRRCISACISSSVHCLFISHWRAQSLLAASVPKTNDLGFYCKVTPPAAASPRSKPRETIQSRARQPSRCCTVVRPHTSGGAAAIRPDPSVAEHAPQPPPQQRQQQLPRSDPRRDNRGNPGSEPAIRHCHVGREPPGSASCRLPVDAQTTNRRLCSQKLGDFKTWPLSRMG